MTIRQAFESARARLTDAGIEDAALEAEVLLRFVLGMDRTQFYTEPDTPLTELQEFWYNNLTERRMKGEPSAYITGRRDFYGLGFRVTPAVLIPRPETELLVEKAIDLADRYRYHALADIGTGSGCIAITLAVHCTDVHIQAIDISQEALDIASGNCGLYELDQYITFKQGDLLEPLTAPVDMITANLPYVDELEMNSVNTKGYEPDLALDGGRNGMDVIGRMIEQLPGRLNKGGSVLFEIDPRQAEKVTALLRSAFPDGNAGTLKDLAGRERVVILTIS